ncbi:MAG: sulfatase [Planctomycetaceae bacterium]
MNTLLLRMLVVFLSAANSMVIAAEKPNVLLIITDEHNFRTLGCYRETLPREQAEMWGLGAVVETPNLDLIAQNGVICTRAYATTPVCSPCRAAMITGRFPHATGVPTNDKTLDRSIPTLADRLADAGYRTGFVGKWHLGGNGKPEWSPKVNGGFQFSKYMFNRGHWKKFAMEDGEPRVAAEKGGRPTYDVDNADSTSFSTDWLTDRAIEFIEGEDQAQPFFAVISYPDPHGPNTVREPYDHLFDNLPFTPPRTYRSGIPSPKWLAGGNNHPIFRGPEMSRYFGMVKCIDDNVGRLLIRLSMSGQLQNTLIMMTSDHGDLCYEHDRLNKGNPYEGSARVPMLVSFPGRIKAGQAYTKPIGTVDVTPTIMGLLNLPANADDQGRNLASDLRDAKGTEDSVKSETTILRSATATAHWIAAVDHRYKLILSTDDVPWLFDAAEDPDELKNFYRQPGTEAITKSLAKALKTYRDNTSDPQFENEHIAASLKACLSE